MKENPSTPLGLYDVAASTEHVFRITRGLEGRQLAVQHKEVLRRLLGIENKPDPLISELLGLTRPLYAGNTHAPSDISDEKIKKVLQKYVTSKSEGGTNMCIALANACNVPVEDIIKLLDELPQSRASYIADSLRGVLKENPSTPLRLQNTPPETQHIFDYAVDSEGQKLAEDYKNILERLFGIQNEPDPLISEILGLKNITRTKGV